MDANLQTQAMVLALGA